LEDLTPFKYKKGMSNLTDFYNSTNLKMRHNIVRPIRKSGFKYSEIRRLGYPTSRKLWISSLYDRERKRGKKTFLFEKIFTFKI
jgi:hypothetical protein